MTDDSDKDLTIARVKAVFFAVGAQWPTLEDAHDEAAIYQADLFAAGRESIGPMDKLDGSGVGLYVGKVPPDLPVPMPAGAALINYMPGDYIPYPAVVRERVEKKRKARRAKKA